MMQVFVVRATIPDSIEGMQSDIEGRYSETLEMFTETSTLVDLMEGTVGDWSLPRHVLVGDIVLFQVALTARTRAKMLRNSLTVDDRHVEMIQDTLELAERHAGSVMAIARVSGGVYRADSEERWGSRYYAPVTDMQYLYFPVPVNSPSRFSNWPEFTSHGPVQYRQFSDDERYRDLISALIDEGNDDIPGWSTDEPVTSLGDGQRLTKDSWMGIASSVEYGFPTEASLRHVYSDWLLRELSDRRILYTEVDVRRSGLSVGTVDNVIVINNVPVPVEVKVNASTEKDLFGQLNRYRSPGGLVTPKRRWPQVDHDIVLLVDQEGVYITRSGMTQLPMPSVARGDTSTQTLGALRLELEAALKDGGT